MKRRLMILFTVFLLLMSLAAPMAMATETEETAVETTEETTEETSRYSTATSGTCGKNITWQLDDHTLILTGSGAMDAGAPWEFYKDSIHALILQGPITTIGDEAFYSCNNLRYVDFGSSLVEIGYQAFYSCNSLEAIRLPASFRKFGPECFRDCSGLQVIYCEGPMPSFKSSCLYTDHTVQIFFPNNTPWPQEEVARLMGNFGSRLYVTGGTPDVLEDYLADVEVTVPEPQSIPEVTEETVPETTVPETTVPETTTPPTTEATTEPTAAPTVAVTEPAPAEEEAVFQLESEPLFVTEPEREQEQEAENETQSASARGGIISTPLVWVLIAAAALTGILILILLIRMIVHSGGRYED